MKLPIRGKDLDVSGTITSDGIELSVTTPDGSVHKRTIQSGQMFQPARERENPDALGAADGLAKRMKKGWVDFGDFAARYCPRDCGEIVTLVWADVPRG